MKTILQKAPLITVVLFIMHFTVHSQELYVFTDPASNMPAKSASAKLTAKYLGVSGKTGQRYTPELMIGVNKLLMVHGLLSFSDMYSNNLRWESARVYAKYRFLSLDDVHRHFRMAVFGEYAYSRNDLIYDELSLEGDQSGGQAGLILTGLLHKLAVSSTLSYVGITSSEPKSSPLKYPNQAFTYSLSAGFLVLPIKYKDFNQTNLNVYGEFLGQRSTDMRKYYTDFAPALQLIFNSNLKINLGYRFQLQGNMQRMAKSGWLIGIERTFLDAFKNK